MSRERMIKLLKQATRVTERLIDEGKVTVAQYMAFMNNFPLDVVEEITISDSLGAKINDYYDSLEN